MKKQIMSKRGRRFDEGGEVQNIPRARTAEEDQESADKAAGLAASNKDKSMGFFERLRAGNIDDPSSEAYKRFGAGRGRADRVPVVDVMPTPVEAAPAITNKSEGMGAFTQRLQAAKNAEAEGAKITEGERIALAMASKPDRIVEPAKVVKKPATKDASNYSNEGRYKSPVGTSTAKDTSNYSNEGREKAAPSAKTEAKTETKSEPKKEMYRNLSGKMVEKTPDIANPMAGLGSLIGRGAKAMGEAYDKYEFMTPAKRIAKENKEKREARGYKSGGSVASSRADGIAQRGKTRGKMC
jgi:flagellar hook-associated protein FlgK